MQKVAANYPNIKFAIVDGVIFEDDGKTPMKNVASLVFREHEGSFLVGMIAAGRPIEALEDRQEIPLTDLVPTGDHFYLLRVRSNIISGMKHLPIAVA